MRQCIGIINSYCHVTVTVNGGVLFYSNLKSSGGEFKIIRLLDGSLD